MPYVNLPLARPLLDEPYAPVLRPSSPPLMSSFGRERTTEVKTHQLLFFVRGYRSRGHSWIKPRCSPGSRTMRFLSFSRPSPSILR